MAFAGAMNSYFMKKKLENYKEIVGNNMPCSFESPEIIMKIKFDYQFGNHKHFPKNLGNISEEEGKHFHQDIEVMEEC